MNKNFNNKYYEDTKSINDTDVPSEDKNEASQVNIIQKQDRRSERIFYISMISLVLFQIIILIVLYLFFRTYNLALFV